MMEILDSFEIIIRNHKRRLLETVCFFVWQIRTSLILNSNYPNDPAVRPNTICYVLS